MKTICGKISISIILWVSSLVHSGEFKKSHHLNLQHSGSMHSLKKCNIEMYGQQRLWSCIKALWTIKKYPIMSTKKLEMPHFVTLTLFFLVYAQTWYISVYINVSFKDFIYLLKRDTEREKGRDTGRGRSRLHARSLIWDSIPGLQDHTLNQRQMLDHWAI